MLRNRVVDINVVTQLEYTRKDIAVFLVSTMTMRNIKRYLNHHLIPLPLSQIIMFKSPTDSNVGNYYGDKSVTLSIAPLTIERNNSNIKAKGVIKCKSKDNDRTCILL